MEVVGLGTLAMDVLLRVDTLPKEDGFCVIENTTYLPGGSGTNVIVQLARLTARCGYIGKISNDDIGKDLISNLETEGIDTRCMVIKPNRTTLYTNIVVDKAGSKFIMLNMGDVFTDLEEDEVNKEYIKSSKIYYTDLLPSKPAIEGLKIAKEFGLKTVFNMQVGLETMGGFGISKDEILKSLAYVDIFAPCRDGLYAITGTKNLNECKDYIRKYFKGTFLITLGSGGSAAFDENDRMYSIPIMKAKVTDTTGAGDSYIGAFIYSYLLKNEELEKAMEFATACAAYTCTGLGARSSPTLDEVKDFIEKIHK